MSVIAAKLRRLIYGDFFIYRNRMKIHKKDCLGKRQPSLKPVNLAGYRRRTAIWFKKISFNPAVELSYLRPEEQQNLIEAMDFTQAAPSLSQAMRLKKLSQEGGCKLDDMCEILGEIKKGDLERVAFKSEQLRRYFPKSYTPRQMSDVILKLLDQWQKKRQRDKAR